MRDLLFLNGMIMEKIAKEILDIARILVSSSAEKEVERLLLKMIVKSPFKNHVFIVGGYIRDELLEIDSKDLDIVVEMRDGSKKLTHFIHKTFGKKTTRPVQKQKIKKDKDGNIEKSGYPIWAIRFKDDVEFNGEVYKTKGADIEIADTMKEQVVDENSRQRETEYGTLKEDIERRDFTVNMLLKDLTNGEIKDISGISRNDIEKGILRGFPGADIEQRFKEDPLRMIRLVRFQAKYGWNIPKSVLKTVKKNAQRIKIVSSERIMGELEKLMKLGKLRQGIRLMKVLGLLKYVLPEIQELIGVAQPKKYHKEGDVYKHTLSVLSNAPKTVEGQLAALLHDVGKPKTQTILGEEIHFYGHEKVSGEMVEAILRRLKFDSKTIKRVKTMVENHMRPHVLHNASEKSLRKFIRDVGDELVDSILDLAEADALGSFPVENYIPSLRERIIKIRNSPIVIKRKPVLDGNELMELLNISKNDKDKLPILGKISKFLLDLADEFAENGKELTKQEAAKIVLKEFG